MKVKLYMADRKAVYDGHEWADMTTASGYVPACAKASRELDAKIPEWAEANPVVRYGVFQCEEVDE